MTKFESLKIFLLDEGIINSKQLRDMGISGTNISNWVNRGLIERVSKGVYMLPNELLDTLYIMQSKCKKGIYSHETALMLHELSDYTPSKNIMTVPKGYNIHRLQNEAVEFHWINSELHDLGVITMKSSHGNEIRVYDLERTICDIIKYRKKMDRSIVYSAIREYMNRSDAQKFKLTIYAKKLGIYKAVSDVMEVLY